MTRTAVTTPATKGHLSELDALMRPGIIELGIGHPAQELLPVAAMRRANADAVARFGPHMLSYGYTTGPSPLADWLRDRIVHQEGQDVAEDEIAISGGISDALDQLITLCTQPGDVVLVESPTYHFGVRVLRDRPVRLVPVPHVNDQPDPATLADLVAQLKRDGLRPRLLYCVPTYNNPTGMSWPTATRGAVVELAANEDILIVEDDVYRDLPLDEDAPASLWASAPRGVVARLGSFSKSVAPGLRVGWITAEGEVIARIRDCGLMDSRGGCNQYTALAVAAYCESGAFDHHLAQFRAAYRARRDALCTALAEHLPAGCTFDVPRGGFFVWLRLPNGMSARALKPLAEQHGVSFAPSQRFYADESIARDDAMRMAFTMYDEAKLVEGSRRLGAAVREMRSEAR
jgi:DNA-binding transcriptional MocR family regulator